MLRQGNLPKYLQFDSFILILLNSLQPIESADFNFLNKDTYKQKKNLQQYLAIEHSVEVHEFSSWSKH